MQLVLVELFLNVDFRAERGWKSWTCMPTKVVLLAFTGSQVDAMKVSVSIAPPELDCCEAVSCTQLFAYEEKRAGAGSFQGLYPYR